MDIKDNIKKAFLRLRTLLLLLWPISFIVLKASRASKGFTEHFFLPFLFRPLVYIIGTVTGLFPFSVAEISIIAAPFLLIALIAGFVVKMVKKKELRLFYGITFVMNCLIMAGVVYFFYVFGCGANYNRVSVPEQMNLTVKPSSKEELAQVLTRLIELTNEAREDASIQEDGNGVFKLSVSHSKMKKNIRDAYKDLKRLDVSLSFMGPNVKPKGMIFSHQMSMAMMTGIYTCWTMEANVDMEVPEYSIYGTMAHELSHLNGFIREDEANFIAFLVGLRSEDPEIRYSCFMDALIYTMNAYYSVDAEHYQEVVAPLCGGIRRDLAYNNEYWKQFEHTKIAETVDNINDSYIKDNNVESGVRNYGEVVDLLLALYEKEGF